MAELLPHGTAAEIEGDRHVLNDSYPDELVALIERFLLPLGLSQEAPPPDFVAAFRRVPPGA